MRREDKWLCLCFGVLVTGLTTAILLVRAERRQPEAVLPVSWTAAASTMPAATPIPGATRDFAAVFAPTPAPDREVLIQRKISSLLRIDAQAREPASLRLPARPVVPVRFDAEVVLDRLFQQPDAKRRSEDMGNGRTDHTNDAGEFALVEPGRLDYCVSEPDWAQYHALFPLAEEGSLRGGWYLPSRESLEKELAFQCREEAAAEAEALCAALLPGGFPYTPRVEVLRALSLETLQKLHRQAKGADIGYGYDELPGSGEGGRLNQGIYYIRMRFYDGETPLRCEPLDTMPGSTTYAACHMAASPYMELALSSQGLVLLESSGLWQPRGEAQPVDCIPVEQAVEALAQHWQNSGIPYPEEPYHIDEIYLMYAPLRRGVGENADCFLQPVWCFEDSDFQGEFAHLVNQKMYLDAETGLPIPEIK